MPLNVVNCISTFIKNNKRPFFELTFYLVISLKKMFQIKNISFVDCNSNGYINWLFEFTDSNCYLKLIRSMISAIPVFTKLGFSSVKNNTCPVQVYICLFKTINRKLSKISDRIFSLLRPRISRVR